MAGVYVLAGIVTYSRLAAEIEADVLTGGWCFIAGPLLLLLGDLLLDRRRIWQAIRPDIDPAGPGAAARARLRGLPAARPGEP